jgi:hypothetical protein
MKNHDILGFQIPGVGDVKDTHDKNAKVVKCEMLKYVDLTPFQSFEYWELEVSRTLTTRMLKR